MTEDISAEEFSRPSNLPIASAEDIEFSDELADEEDQEAQQRAAAADERATAGREE
ncbi:YfhD family protein [Cohnella sp.]|uniref:YfhD family protein n=1 Tax=Cohnella sp. TaxID=1883426 RepID=UPI0035645443